MKKLVISVLLINLLAACASQKPKEAEAESKPSASVTESSTSTSDGAVEATRVPDVAVDGLDDPHGTLSKRSVYYPLDVYAVQDADKPTVQAHAKYLSGHASQKVRLEGNCDERGSDEYNLALGQRRADGVKKMLVLGGVKDSQIETVSYGEEKPKASGHEESAWAQNRRTDLNYVK